MRRVLARGLVAVLLATLGSGCMFKVEHRLPPHSYFGRLPEPVEHRRPFENSGMKNWALAGLIPYSGWGTEDLVPVSKEIRRVEDLSIETRFGVIDTIVWVVPGFFYGYYIWAPRTVKISGTEVLDDGAAASARGTTMGGNGRP